MRRRAFVLALVFVLLGCAPRQDPGPTEPETAPPITQETLEPEQEAENLSAPPEPAVSIVLEPEASGTRVESCAVAEVDYSHTEDGYIMVRYLEQSDRRLKVLLKGPTTTYQYNLVPGQWSVFPLSDGDGSYQAGIYRNISGDKYATVMTARFPVELQDEFAPFLRPNQYVNYLNAPNTMDLVSGLCAGQKDPLGKVAAVYEYVVNNLSYDEEKAMTVRSGYLPVLDQVLQEQKGICFDYAALMTAMLRSQQVPCKLVVGYAGDIYHAWISVWTQEDGWIDGIIFFDGKIWKRMDPTFASANAGDQEIMDFIEHGTYTVKYLY